MNNMVSPDFLRQRRAVYHGLCGVLAEAEADKALSLWMQRAQSGSVFSGLNSFVKDLCTMYGRPELQREMLMSINRALMAKEEELRPAPSLEANVPVAERVVVPQAEPVAKAVPSVPEAGNDTPEFQAFKFFVLELMDQVDLVSPSTGMTFRDFIKDVVVHSAWSEAQQEQVTLLVDTGTTVQTRPYRAGQLKTLSSHLRAWLTDNLGENAGNTIVAQAIANTNKSDAGMAYPAKQFI